MYIDLERLNPLEKEIYDRLMKEAASGRDIRINEASELCGCSPSKISKFAKKAGFSSFRKFMDYAQGKAPGNDGRSSELERIRKYTEEFDQQNVESFVNELKAAKKIVLIGYGPSFYCAGYMEYKLRLILGTPVMSVPDITSARNLLEEGTLIVVFSTSGQFISFAGLCAEAKEKGAKVLMVTEEYHPELIREYDNIIFLTDSVQSDSLAAHDKSRVCTLIFIEEAVFALLRERNDREDKSK